VPADAGIGILALGEGQGRLCAATGKLRARSFTLDGEAMVCGGDGVAVFDALHRRHQAGDATSPAAARVIARSNPSAVFAQDDPPVRLTTRETPAMATVSPARSRTHHDGRRAN
jgi:hypothetical protein